MNRYLKGILSLFLLASAFVCAQDLKLHSSQTQKQPATPPNPIELKPTWWEYFDVPHSEFAKRANEAMTYYRGMKNELPLEIQSQGYSLIDRIVSSLEILRVPPRALPNLEEKQANYKEKYTLDEFRELIRALYQINKKEQNQEFQKKLIKENIATDKENLDTRFASYIHMKESQEKLIQGFIIIVSKLEIELENRQLQAIEYRTKSVDLEKKALIDEITFARSHLVVSKETMQALQERLSKGKSALTNQRSHITEIQSRYYITQEFSENEEQRSELSQVFLHSTLDEKSASVSLIQTEVLGEYAEILTQENINPSPVYKKLETWKNLLHEIEKEKSEWEQSSLIDMENSIQNQQIRGQYSNRLSLSQESLLKIDQLEEKLFVTNYLIDQLVFIMKTKYHSLPDRLKDVWYSALFFVREHIRWIDESLFTIGNTPVTLRGLFKFFVIAILSYVLARLAKRAIHKFGKKQAQLTEAAYYTLSRLVYYLILTIGIILATASLGIDFTAFAFIAGALSVGIGFGLQSIFNNFVAGIILLVERSIRPGDLITLDTGELGRVIEVKVRTTIIKTFDNLEILVPNSELVAKKFTNWTLSEKVRRVRVPFGVAFGTDKKRLEEVVVEAARKVPTTIPTQDPTIQLVSIGDSSLNFELLVWVNEYIDGLTPITTTSRYLWAIETALKDNGIEIPFPVRDVKLHMEKGDGTPLPQQ